MKKWKKRNIVILITAAILFILVTACVFLIFIPEMNNEKIRQMQINDVDLSVIDDGTYRGEFAYGHYTYHAEVVVKDHRIEQISVRHGRDSEHAKAAEGVIDNIIAEQKIDVDVVSGATTTSKAILKAVENALSR